MPTAPRRAEHPARRASKASARRVPARAVVLGGGVAGLVAARRLEAGGVDVVVLEATGRVGGRVRTLRGFSDGSHAEAGGELLEPRHEALFRLLAELRLPTTAVLSRGFRFWEARGERPETAWEEFEADLATEAAAFERARRSWKSAVARRWAD